VQYRMMSPECSVNTPTFRSPDSLRYVTPELYRCIFHE
jgi:hypothetical protein